MPLFTPEQLHEIRQIIEDQHDAFVANTLGVEALSPERLAELREKKLISTKTDAIRDAYVFGQLAGMMESDEIARMTYREFQRYLKKNPVPLSSSDQHAIRIAQQSAGQYCRGLGNRVNSLTGDTLIEADARLRAETEEIIQDATAYNRAKRETTRQLKSDLGWKTADWARDWQRIANTELQTSMQRGLANHYREEFGGDVLVAKRPMPDACEHCQRVHLGPDGNPRVFRLRDLEANGTNVGRKARDWQAVVGTVHPNCQCQMIRVPAGWGFDETGSLVPGAESRVYGTRGDLERSLQGEHDLEKAFKLQGAINYRGIPIAIENRKGTVRKWRDAQGGTGETRMQVGYGYIRRTNGIDEDEIDVFVGTDPDADMVYVIEQQNPDNGIYDEQKCMVGFPNQGEAERIYLEHYDRSDFALYTTPMELEHFKRWVATTAPQKGEMMKKGTHGIRLVIPLAKARVPAIDGAARSQAANRSPSPGTSPNYVMQDMPLRPPVASIQDVGYAPRPQDLVDTEEWVGNQMLRVDPEVYNMGESQREPRPIELPDDLDAIQEGAREGTEQRMRYIIREGQANTLPSDLANLPGAMRKSKTDRPPTVGKNGQLNVIDIGPRGGKIVGYKGGKPIYLHKLTSKQRAQAEARGKPESKPATKRDPAAEKTTPPSGSDPGAYLVDPTVDADGDGVAEAARVGVPASALPPPPKVPRLPNLTAEERRVESKFIKAFEDDPDGMAKAFLDHAAQNNYVFETDEAKALMPEWSRPDLPPDKKGEPPHPERAEARAKYNTVLHQTANAIAKRAFMMHLNDIAKMPEEKRKILVTSGGVAGGKGSALKARPDLPASVSATWDAAGEQNATENTWVLRECEKRGIKPVFLHVNADPAKTWKGAIIRAKAIGRMVDARVFADSYALGAKNMHAFYERNKDRASFVFAQAEWPNPAKFLDDFPEEALELDADDLYRKSLREIERQKAELPPHIVAGATAGQRIWRAAR